MRAVGEGSLADAEKIADDVIKDIEKITTKYRGFVPGVESVQDIVEKRLILSEFAKTAKAYILYRDERARIRAQRLQSSAKSEKTGRRKQEILPQSARRVRLLPQLFQMDGRRRPPRDIYRDRRQICFVHARESRRQTDRDRVRRSARRNFESGIDAFDETFAICRQGRGCYKCLRIQLRFHCSGKIPGPRRDHVHIDVRHRHGIRCREPQRAKISANKTADRKKIGRHTSYRTTKKAGRTRSSSE